MDFSIVPVSKAFKTYQGQARIADLNKKSSIKRLQGQKDEVSISSAARVALKKKFIGMHCRPQAKKRCLQILLSLPQKAVVTLFPVFKTTF